LGASRKKILALFGLVALIVLAGLVALIASSTPPAVTPASTAVTSISSSSGAILASAVSSDPSGFTQESSMPDAHVGGALSGSWAELGQPDGTVANLTVVVYASTNASQAYIGRLVASVKGLPGYTDVSYDLVTFQRYGTCYAYGEDVDSIGVVNGVCTVGNVFLQVHLVSGDSLSTLETYMTSLMGALYQSAL
jgi:hypothetical protein